MAAPVTSTRRSAVRLRRLSASDLGIGRELALRAHASSRPDDPPLADDDPHLHTVVRLLASYGGVIFTGPPGTSKSWYARKIGWKLADGDAARVRVVQLHPSYQYEDFMQGFVPRTTADRGADGFELKDKHFVAMCKQAADDLDRRYVLIIDELSRAEAGRVFGEALTHVEQSYRGVPFALASGEEIVVPPNLVILATMNPLDRGVDEVDMAFERRFAKIAMEPDRELLLHRLTVNGLPEHLRQRIASFFSRANSDARANPLSAIGHTYFFDVTDEETLRLAWDHQLWFLIERAYRLDPETRKELEAAFERLFDPPPEDDAADDAS